MRTRHLTSILAALTMIGALSIDAYLPALPAIALHFGVSLAAAQQSLTIYLFAFATMTLFTARFPIRSDAGPSFSSPSPSTWWARSARAVPARSRG